MTKLYSIYEMRKSIKVLHRSLSAAAAVHVILSYVGLDYRVRQNENRTLSLYTRPQNMRGKRYTYSGCFGIALSDLYEKILDRQWTSDFGFYKAVPDEACEKLNAQRMES